MKVLKVRELTTNLNDSMKAIHSYQTQLDNVITNVNEFLSLEDAFQGKGADALKSFFQECHVPFLTYYNEFLITFYQTLKSIEEAYPAVEPENDGVIHTHYLETELQQDLTKIQNITVELTDAANDTISKISDIVHLSPLKDRAVLKGIEHARKNIKETVEDVEQFDAEQSKELQNLQTTVSVLTNYVKQCEDMIVMNSAITNSAVKQFKKTEAYQTFKDEQSKYPLPFMSEPRVTMDWKAPVSSFGNGFGTVTDGAALLSTSFKVVRNGTTISKVGDHHVVKSGESLGIKSAKYHENYIKSQVKLGNNLKVAEYVSPVGAVKSTLKGKIGWLGIGVTTVENINSNVQSNASTSKIVGDAAVDVGLGAVSLAGGAFVVGLAGAFSAPIVAAAAVGFLASVSATYAFEGIRFGKSETTVSDTLKENVEKSFDSLKELLK
ncbi:LXG domain-containing protein [Metabacillus iocasae]|uniref:LXG domain-containing protein n=1 Tax=Priestia iocasae TaxID=2291674 RepID=A0ABS2QWB4_9BACI|nr:LXG domain-containing protein [Metabacillus iocasae]MBM7703282.1 hypothetical protein [Metabacillus iocasae]